MKFKVNDKVRVIRDNCAPEKYVGQVGIIEMDGDGYYRVRFDDGDCWSHNDTTVEPIYVDIAEQIRILRRIQVREKMEICKRHIEEVKGQLKSWSELLQDYEKEFNEP